LIVNGKATLAEIETHYSLTDVIDANEAFDLQLEADRLAHEAAAKKRGK
jgi:hypothetical protein